MTVKRAEKFVGSRIVSIQRPELDNKGKEKPFLFLVTDNGLHLKVSVDH